jgi:predicted DCC family thiol-disulfide oxidoreductase YuxK
MAALTRVRRYVPDMGSAPPGDVLFFDGACPACRRAVARLQRRLGPGRVEARSFRAPGALDAFPGLDPERCRRALQLVRADGEVFAGVEAVVQALRHRRLGRLARLYYLPPLRQLADATYRAVARRRRLDPHG